MNRKFWPLLILSTFILIILAGLITTISLYLLRDKLPTKPKTANAIVVSDTPIFNAPTKFVYLDILGNVHLSDLDGKNDKTLFTSNGSFGHVVSPAMSPDGKYLAYLALPDEVVTSLNANPPYEMHGSGDYVLWLTDLSTLQAIPIQQKFTYGIGSDPAVIWTPDSKGFFFDIQNNDANYSISSYFYELAGKNKHLVEARPSATANISPDAGYFVKIQEEYIMNTADSNITLKQYDSAGKFVKDLYSARRYPYANLNYISSNYVVLASNMYGDAKTEFKEGDIKCYVDLIDVTSSTATNIETRNCWAPQTYSGLLLPKLSPDSKHLLSLYVDAERTPSAPYNSEIFVYDMNTRTSKYIAKQEGSYDNYYFVSSNEIIVTDHIYSSEKTLYKGYKVNIATGTITELIPLLGKQIIGIF